MFQKGKGGGEYLVLKKISMRKNLIFSGKDVSKEISNLKEFLIQQGKEIVRLKQDVKVRIEGIQN